MGKTKMSRSGSYLNFSKSGTKSKSRSASGMPSGVDTRMSKSGASKSRSKSGMSRSASARSKSKSKSGMAASKSGFRTSGGSKLMVPSKSGYKSQSRSGASRSKSGMSRSGGASKSGMSRSGGASRSGIMMSRSGASRSGMSRSQGASQGVSQVSKSGWRPTGNMVQIDAAELEELERVIMALTEEAEKAEARVDQLHKVPVRDVLKFIIGNSDSANVTITEAGVADEALSKLPTSSGFKTTGMGSYRPSQSGFKSGGSRMPSSGMGS